MGDKSAIEWTDATWNPIIGCSRVSEGCRNCYAERTAIRQASPSPYPAGDQSLAPNKPGRYFGLVKSTPAGPRWTGEVRLVEAVLDAPLRWKRPRRIFVNSMGDLFHEKVPDDWLYRVFAVMALCPQHTFQILTKRPERMRAFFKDGWDGVFYGYEDTPEYRRVEHRGNSGNKEWYQKDADRVSAARRAIDGTPLPHIHLGVSVEDQATADERIPILLQTPAAVRWVSYEPALGPVSFAKWCPIRWDAGRQVWHREREIPWVAGRDGLAWIVVGGESGPGARPFDLAWARSTIKQCRAAGVPVFVKQLGARPVEYWCASGAECTHPDCGNKLPPLRDRKGGDPQDWPEDLRVREYPR